VSVIQIKYLSLFIIYCNTRSAILTNNQLRERLHRQIDRLMPGKLRLTERILSILEENEPLDTVREDTTEYPSLKEIDTAVVVPDIPPSEKDWRPNRPFSGTREEWFQYFREIEEGEFSSLDEANKEFEQWKM